MIDEEYVGKLKAVVAASVQGTPMEIVPQKVAEKMRWIMHFLAEDV